MRGSKINYPKEEFAGNPIVTRCVKLGQRMFDIIQRSMFDKFIQILQEGKRRDLGLDPRRHALETLQSMIHYFVNNTPIYNIIKSGNRYHSVLDYLKVAAVIFIKP